MKSMLVIGLGRFGQHLASNLLDLGNDVMIIDSDERKLEGLVPYATSSKSGTARILKYCAVLESAILT